MNSWYRFIRRNFELLFWLSALVFLGFTTSDDTHFSFCLIRLAGFHWCPGCGIGHAIGYLLQGKPQLSWEAHVLGIPAFFVILQRIYVLLTQHNLASRTWSDVHHTRKSIHQYFTKIRKTTH